MTTELCTPATGNHTTNGIPHGRTSITPHIVVTRAKEAIGFYTEALGATAHGITEMGGILAHAELEFSNGWITLSDPQEAYAMSAPTPESGSHYSLALYVEDVDAVAAAAEARGATIREAPTTFVSGDRFASILDPFGVRWSLMCRVEDLSPQESERRVNEWAASQG
jgi:PhnB protein